MRTALLHILTREMERDESVCILTADTGFQIFEDLQARFPDRFLNVGISESAMIGMAAGLALAGKNVFTYGIVPFVTMRCFEQIRDDLCYPNLPVKIVGVGGGLTYGAAGMTHHSIEDIAVMSALPNMTVVCPGDPVEAGLAAAASLTWPGPCYLRLGKSGEPAIHPAPPAFRIGKGIVLRDGKDAALIATGNMLPVAAEACTLLENAGVDTALVSMHTVKPLDVDLVRHLAASVPLLATIEEHSIIGGLGSAVAAQLADDHSAVRLKRFALPDAYAHQAGSQQFLRESCGLTAARIADTIMRTPQDP